MTPLASLRLVCALIALLLPVTTLGLADTRSANLSFRHVLQNQMESIGYINAIAQDATGFMWFGGANGLARYDGYELKIYRYDDHQKGSLSHSYVNCLLLDRSGNLWVGTREGLNLYNPETDDFSIHRHPNETSTAISADDIRTVFEDSRGQLWLGTRSGLYAFDRQRQTYHRYQLNAGFSDPMDDNIIWSIAEDQQGSLWIGNHTSGISRMDLATNSFQHFLNQTLDDEGIAQNDVRTVYVDSHNRIWAGTYGGGIFLFNRNEDTFEPFEHDYTHNEKSRTIWDFQEDRDGNLWIGDGHAVVMIDAESSYISRFSYNAKDSESPGNFVVNELFEDRAGDMWVGYFPSGIDIVDRQAAVFRNYTYDPEDPGSVSDGGILSSWEDDQHNLWVGAGYGLNYFNRNNNTISHYFHDPGKPDSLSGNTVLSLLEDHQKRLWLGIWSGGLNRRVPGTVSFVHYQPEENNPRSLLGREPWALLEDNQQRLWVATEAGVNRYNPETDDFTRYLPRQDQMDGDITLYCRTLLEDSRGGLWVGSIRGLYRINPDTHGFTRFHHNPEDPTSISNDYVIALYEDSRQRIWVGTHGGGLNLFDPHTGRFTAYTTADGLPDDVVTGIVEDVQGHIWFSTQQGLTEFDTSNDSFRSFDQSHGLSGNLFNRNTPLRTYDNQLFFGNSRGFVMFDPVELEINRYAPPVAITDFRIFNQPVNRQADDGILDKAIEHTGSITLDHRHSMISFEFAALNFRSPDKNQYAYWLEGFDNDWLQAGNSRTATYTNLDPGRYTLQVKAANNDGVWNQGPVRLDIRILPPPWRTWWAYALYLLVLGAGIYGIITVLVSRQAYQKEHLLNKRLLELDDLKDQFLANTSHELRTPLSGMIGLSEALLHTEGLDGDSRDKLEMIAATGKRLSNLINEILDYSRLADNKQKLHFQSVDLYLLTELVYSLLEPLTHQKPVRLINALSPNMPRVHADENRLQQILINLVGNAIKYTNEGYITVSGEVLASRIRISVEDSGVGIDPEQLDGIFLPFQQIERTDNTEIEGTGLGLTVCRKLVELHGGSLRVRSQPGSGSEFIFDLPISSESGNTPDPGRLDHDIRHSIRQTMRGMQTPASRALQRGPRVKPEFQLQQIEPPEAANCRILVVDDDRVNRMVLDGMLGEHHYQVIEVESGEQALALCERGEPLDLIILDAIMPDLSGYETCKAIRKFRGIRELPIIFLSANAREQDLIAAYAAGGNDYLSKPVSRVELLSKVALHINLSRNGEQS